MISHLHRLIGKQPRRRNTHVINATDEAQRSGEFALDSAKQALADAEQSKYMDAVQCLASVAYHVGACEAHLLHDPGKNHTTMYMKTVGQAVMISLQAMDTLRKKAGWKVKLLNPVRELKRFVER
jgi:hypothetical protein